MTDNNSAAAAAAMTTNSQISMLYDAILKRFTSTSSSQKQQRRVNLVFRQIITQVLRNPFLLKNNMLATRKYFHLLAHANCQLIYRRRFLLGKMTSPDENVIVKESSKLLNKIHAIHRHDFYQQLYSILNKILNKKIYLNLHHLLLANGTTQDTLVSAIGALQTQVNTLQTLTYRHISSQTIILKLKKNENVPTQLQHLSGAFSLLH
nr:hypothetical protein [Microctonus hyperodae filamentous virus]